MTLSIVLPAFNEEKIISRSIDRIINFCQKNLADWQWVVIIADNGSSDKTRDIVKNKKKLYPQLKYFYIDRPCKGLAIKMAWQNYPADINIFMDADLSTELEFIPLLINPILREKYDIVIGSRYMKQSKLQRSFLRSVISRIYNLILKIFFHLNLSDIHCGFKAVNKKIIKELIPKIKNDQLFFDTELLVLAYYNNFKIKQIPINWKEEKQRKSKISILNTSITYLKELVKLKLRPKKP